MYDAEKWVLPTDKRILEAVNRDDVDEHEPDASTHAERMKRKATLLEKVEATLLAPRRTPLWRPKGENGEQCVLGELESLCILGA